MRDFIRGNNCFTINDKNVKDLKNAIGIFNPQDGEVVLTINLDKYDNFSVLYEIFRAVNVYLPSGYPYKFCVEIGNKKFTKNEITTLKVFSQFMQINGYDLSVKEKDIIWSNAEFFATYSVIEEQSKKIESQNFSPFEKFLCAYIFTTNKQYKSEEKNDNPLLSRTAVGAVIQDKIVCRGYSELLSAIIQYINDDNLKCFTEDFDCFEKGKFSDIHSANIVYIKDEKYGLCGLYYADSSCDSITKKGENVKLTHCLIPTNDILFTRDCVMEINYASPFAYFLSDDVEKTQKNYQNKLCGEMLSGLGVFDMEKERQKFAEKVLSQVKKYSQTSEKAGYIEKVEKSLNSRPTFASSHFEYTFLKYLCNKIKTNSKPLDISLYTKALIEVATKYLNLPPKDIKKFVKDTLQHSVDSSFSNFSFGAENSFYKLSCIEAEKRAEKKAEQNKKKKQHKEK